jgi:hypothetical protein
LLCAASQSAQHEASKHFFFEKKKQKTFTPLRAGLARNGPTPREAEQKFFGYFFSKKVTAFLLLPEP